MKSITLIRRELVWETKSNTWDEYDWKNFLEWTERNIKNEKEAGYYTSNFGKFYEKCKDLTWDEVVKDFNEYEYGDSKKCIYWEEIPSWSDKPIIRYLGDFLIDQMREENYDAEVSDWDYADDYDEEFEIEGLDEDKENEE